MMQHLETTLIHFSVVIELLYFHFPVYKRRLISGRRCCKTNKEFCFSLSSDPQAGVRCLAESRCFHVLKMIFSSFASSPTPRAGKRSKAFLGCSHQSSRSKFPSAEAVRMDFCWPCVTWMKTFCTFRPKWLQESFFQ